MRAHADADGRHFHHIGGAFQTVEADFRLGRFQQRAGALVFGGGHGEGDVGGGRIVGHDLDDHIDIDIGLGQRHENRCRHARLVGHAAQGDLGLVFGIGDARDDLLFHDILLVADESAQTRIGRIIERGADIGRHPMNHRQFDRTDL